MSKSKPVISVITCHHTGTLINGFIDSIRAQSFQDIEVIVMTSDEELASTGIKGCLVVHSTAMPAEKRNIGARLAKGEYLAFFDDDVELYHTCLAEFKKTLDEFRGCGMVYGKLWNMEHRNRFDEAGGYLTSTGFLWSRAGQNDIDNGQFDKMEPILAGKSASCMVRKDVFNRVDGFDESFGILGEETDLSWRIWLIGYGILFNPEATGYHAFNTKFKPKEKHYTNDRVFFNGSRNYITMLIKNLGREHLWVLGLHVPIWVGVGIVMCITGKVRQGTSIIRGVGYVLMNLRAILTKRKTIQDRRVNSDRDIWGYIFRRTSWAYYRTRVTRYLTLGLHG